MKILVLNAGSSSLKWKLFEILETPELIASGLVEGIGEAHTASHLDYQKEHYVTHETVSNHLHAFNALFQALKQQKVLDIETELSAIGHRVVHGGEQFTQATLITPEILIALKKLNILAPLHNPANILGIETLMQLVPDLPNVAVFDTAFHSTLPKEAFLYALPTKLYEEAQIRRYGFHGTSHHYVAQESAKILERPLSKLNLITLHLGNGASACAIKNGESVDTSMGFTPLEGLVMGTRCGDIDPAIVTYLTEQQKLSAEAVSNLLNKESGLKGLCGENDLRLIIERATQGDNDAITALDVFVYHIRKYIGAYIAVLGDVDAIVFTGGIGEHAPLIRQKVMEGFDKSFGIVLDNSKNEHLSSCMIHKINSRIKLLVIATNEELQIALETTEMVKKL